MMKRILLAGIAAVLLGLGAALPAQADPVPPVTDITAGPAEGSVTSQQSATFEFEVQNPGDYPDATFECRLDSSDDQDWATCASGDTFPALPDGAHTFEVRAVDPGAGTGPAATRTWTVDTTAPVLTIESGPDGPVASDQADFTFSADEPVTDVECRLDTGGVEGTWEECDTPTSQSYSSLADDFHAIHIRATDAAGNTGQAFRLWVVDTADPVVAIDSFPAPEMDGNVHSIRANFTFSATDFTVVTFECRLDSTEEADWGACTSPQGYDNLADGSHTFEVRATDAAGNASDVETHTWGVLTDPPVTDITAGPAEGSVTSQQSATFEFEIEPVSGVDYSDATFECRLDSSDDQGWAACASGDTFTTLADGSHSFEVRAIDPDQGAGAAAGPRTWTVDTVKPTVEITGKPDPISGTADPEFSFTADDATATTFECRLDSIDDNDWATCTSPQQYNGLSETQHHFEVRATDAAGNVSDVEDYTWLVETTPPAVTITSPDPESPTTFIKQTFTFETGNPNAFFECRLDSTDDNDWAICATPITYDQLSDDDHTFEVRAVGHGAGPGAPAVKSWTVDTVVPTVRITSGPDQLTNRTDADFTFEMSKSGFDLECRLDSSDDNAWAACDSDTAQSYTGLNADDHTFEVRAVDQGGNPVGTATATWEWTVLADPPVATITEAPPFLSASATAVFRFESDVPAATFKCRLDGGAWKTCTSPAAPAGLGDGDHTFEVRATLPDGPAGAVSDVTWAIDTTAPEVRIKGGPNGTVSADTANFTVTSDDPSATTECSLDGAAWQSCGGALALAGLADGTHVLRARSVDQAGNAGADKRTWTVNHNGPVTSLTGKPAASTTDTVASFDFSSDRAGVSFECRLDSGTWSSCSPVYTTSELALGEHTFEVRGTDRYGNVGPVASHGWAVVREPFKGLVPTIKIRRKAKLTSGGNALLARIECPEGACRITAPKRVKFKLNGRTVSPGIKVIRNSFTGRANATLISSVPIRKLVARYGPARFKIRFTVRSENGKSSTRTARVKLTAKR